MQADALESSSTLMGSGVWLRPGGFGCCVCSVTLPESSLQAPSCNPPELHYSIKGCVMNTRLWDAHSEKNSLFFNELMNQNVCMFLWSALESFPTTSPLLSPFFLSFLSSFTTFLSHPCTHPTNPKSVILWGQFFIWMLLLACFFSGTE